MADANSLCSDGSSTKLVPSERIRRITMLDKYTEASLPAKIFLFLATAHAASLISLGIASLAWENIEDVYGALAVFVAICLLWFMKEGILKENTLQLIFSIISAVLITVFLIWLWAKDSAPDQKHAIVIIMAFGSSACVILYCILAPFVMNKFGWYRYNKTQTTNTDVMNTFYVYQKWEAFVLMDAEVCIMFGILVVDQLNHRVDGYVFNFFVLTYEVIWLAVGIRSVRTENVLWLKIFAGSVFILYGYIFLNFYWVDNDINYSKDATKPQFFVLGTFCVVVRAIVMYLTYRVWQNFGKGLGAFFNAGDHYKDFWGETSHNLLDDKTLTTTAAKSQGTAYTTTAAYTTEKTARSQGTDNSIGGMSSRSRINSNDFD